MIDGREIDVLIEDSLGPYRIKIAVEAKDERRKLDITKFEQIVGKYRLEGGVKVDKIVVITHGGFSKQVIARARTLGVDILTLREAGETDWLTFDPRLWFLNTMFRITDVTLLPQPQGIDFEELLATGRVIWLHGTDCGTPIEFARGLFWKNAMRTQTETLKELASNAERVNEGWTARLEVQFPSNDPCVVRFGEHHFSIERLKCMVHAKAVPETARPSLTQFKFNVPLSLCGIEVTPPVPGFAPSDLWNRAVVVCSRCGRNYGSLRKWLVEKIRQDLKSNPDAASQISKVARELVDGQAWHDISYRVQNCAIRIDNAQFGIETVTAVVYRAMVPMRSTQFQLESTDGSARPITRLEATVAGRTLDFVHSDGLASGKIALRIVPISKVSVERDADCDDCERTAPTD